LSVRQSPFKRRRRDAEPDRGASWSGHFPVSGGKRRFDDLFFPVLERSVSGGAGDVDGSRADSQALSTRNVDPVHKMTERSTMFWSSRMLPGQSYARQRANVSFSIVRMCFPILSEKR
jgi:hypothetical protein